MAVILNKVRASILRSSGSPQTGTVFFYPVEGRKVQDAKVIAPLVTQDVIGSHQAEIGDDYGDASEIIVRITPGNYSVYHGDVFLMTISVPVAAPSLGAGYNMADLVASTLENLVDELGNNLIDELAQRVCG